MMDKELLNKILIVNDDPDQLELLQVLLTQAGYRALTAGNGQEAFDTADRLPPDLIISDVIMPGDGVELCRRLRADDRFRLTPILLVSALQRDAESVANRLAAGADDFLELPVEPLRLIAKVARLLERHKQEEERARLITRMNDIIANVPGVVWEAYERPDSDRQQIAFVSDYVETMLGYSVGEWLSTPQFWAKILHPDDRERAIQKAVENFAAGTEFSQEFRWIAKDGRIVWVEAQAATIKDRNGNPIGMRGINLDITERKRSEDVAHASEMRFQSLCEAAPLGVFLTDAEGNCLFTNSYLQSVCGFSFAESLGQGFADFFHPEDRDAALAEWLCAAADGREFHCQIRFSHRDGTVRWGSIRTAPMYDSERRLNSHVGTVEDITEQKNAEIVLAEANERAIREYQQLVRRVAQLAEVLGKARDLTTIYKALYEFAVASTPTTGLIVSLYEPKTKMRTAVYGCAHGEELDVSTLPSLPLTDSPQSRAILRGQTTITDDLQADVKDQPVVHVGLDLDPRLPQSALIVPMLVMGRTLGAVAVQSTERAAFRREHAAAIEMAANLAANAIENVRLLEQERAQDEQRRQSQRLESIGKLAGGVAHDFNNMLTVIRGYSELTLSALERESPLVRNLHEIKKAAERSAGLTQQLLAFSRRQMLQPRILDLNAVIKETTNMLHRLIGEDIELITELEPGLSAVEADQGQLIQVIMNLAVNARDAMTNGGALVIKTADVDLDDEYAAAHPPLDPGRYVMLSVSDTGTGIEKTVQSKIFEPFFTTKAAGSGTGLGLSTVYGIVKQSCGYIWVESEIGQGTTFYIYLPPVAAAAVKVSEASDAPTLREGTETILLVEDEDSVRDLSRTILEACGYRIIEARNGREALSIAAESEYQFDLLVTDVVMPEIGGKELRDRLAALRPEIPTIFMSGYTDDAIIRRGISQDGANFLHKPFTAEVLARTVRAALDEAKKRAR